MPWSKQREAGILAHIISGAVTSGPTHTKTAAPLLEPPSVTTRKECRFRCLFPHPSRQSPQTATEKDEGILPPPAYARENVRHSISDNKCCRAASTCSVPTSA
jgi:hypothetical protein